jgi:hypothetical protein
MVFMAMPFGEIRKLLFSQQGSVSSAARRIETFVRPGRPNKNSLFVCARLRLINKKSKKMSA